MPSSYSSEKAQSVRSDNAYHPDGPERPITMLAVINALLRQRRAILAIALLTSVVTLVRGLLTARTYESTASFAPSAATASSGLSGLAAQLGVAVPQSGAVQSPAFYGDLLRSRPLLKGVVEAEYDTRVNGQQRRANLIEIFGIAAESPELRLERAIAALRSSMQQKVALSTGVVTFIVSAESRDLPPQIVDKILDGIIRFDLDTRRTQASMERRFTEQRVSDIRSELRDAEARLLSFQQANRSVGSDPTLQLTRDRLGREVDRLQNLYGSLVQSYERARIDEVRDTPSITIIERPMSAALPTERRIVRKTLIALVLGLLLGVLLAFVREIIIHNQKSNSDESTEFARLRDEMMRELKLRSRRSGASSAPGL